MGASYLERKTDFSLRFVEQQISHSVRNDKGRKGSLINGSRDNSLLLVSTEARASGALSAIEQILGGVIGVIRERPRFHHRADGSRVD
jgi:hypothetical protein